MVFQINAYLSSCAKSDDTSFCSVFTDAECFGDSSDEFFFGMVMVPETTRRVKDETNVEVVRTNSCNENNENGFFSRVEVREITSINSFNASLYYRF